MKMQSRVYIFSVKLFLPGSGCGGQFATVFASAAASATALPSHARLRTLGRPRLWGGPGRRGRGHVAPRPRVHRSSTSSPLFVHFSVALLLDFLQLLGMDVTRRVDRVAAVHFWLAFTFRSGRRRLRGEGRCPVSSLLIERKQAARGFGRSRPPPLSLILAHTRGRHEVLRGKRLGSSGTHWHDDSLVFQLWLGLGPWSNSVNVALQWLGSYWGFFWVFSGSHRQA